MTMRSPADVPVSEAIGSRRQRRRWVVALYGGYLVFGAALLAGDGAPLGAPRLAAGLAGVAGILATLAAVGVLMRRTSINAPQISSRALDERQRARRDRATWLASLTNAILISLFAAYATVTLTLVPAMISPGILSYLLWTAALLVNTLPTAIMAWTEPDPPSE